MSDFLDTTSMAALAQSVRYDDAAKAMTDEQLADALVEKVWTQFNLLSEESALLDAAIDRLKARKR